MYALVDCNNFYASCERVFNPSLQNKPVAILSNNDGCIIARSDEVKKLNLPMGAPIFKWKNFCKYHQITVLSSNYPLYGDMSARVMTILEQFSPNVEVYSIDEAFIDLTGIVHTPLKQYATRIKDTVVLHTGVPVGVGIAPTKVLAKLANKISKKVEKFNYVCVIDTDEKRIKALKWAQTKDVWGLGKKHQARLKKIGVFTAYDFTQLPLAWVRKEMTVVG